MRKNYKPKEFAELLNVNVRLKEYGYIKVGAKVISGTVSKKGDRYYVSVIIDVDMPIVSKNTNEGIGLDLGLKDFAICSNGEEKERRNCY